MSKWIQWLENVLGGGPGGAKRLQTFRWLAIVGLAGIALMILNSFVHVKELDPIESGRDSPKTPQSQETFLAGAGDKDPSGFRDYEHAYETRLKDILQQVVGVSDVEVMVTIDSTEELDVEKNTNETQQITNEIDPKGATRHITDITKSGEVVMYQVSGDQHPLILKKIKPQVRGVVVVAKGAENLTVKKLILEAVERGLSVPSYRISVIPRKQQ